MLLSSEEAEMLQELALQEGLSAAAWLRRIIRQKHAESPTTKKKH